MDFRKAFDSISHVALWEALREQDVSAGYLLLLQALYDGQTGKVRTDVFSKTFNISRGAKQGDPLSSLLFNALLESTMRKLKHQWNQK